uniref:Uncharacterized protein n=1 Tax=Anguilla anguilla TaxID=7936 RepID=A0A0E9TM05_ANGAN
MFSTRVVVLFVVRCGLMRPMMSFPARCHRYGAEIS